MLTLSLDSKGATLNFKAILVLIAVVVIMTPTLILGFTVTPWLFVLLFGLLLVFPFVLAPRADSAPSQSESSEGLARIAFGVALVFGAVVLVLGLLVAPEFFLFMLIVCAPLLWLAFRPNG
jgi:hypothetical protein